MRYLSATYCLWLLLHLWLPQCSKHDTACNTSVGWAVLTIILCRNGAPHLLVDFGANIRYVFHINGRRVSYGLGWCIYMDVWLWSSSVEPVGYFCYSFKFLPELLQSAVHTNSVDCCYLLKFTLASCCLEYSTVDDWHWCRKEYNVGKAIRHCLLTADYFSVLYALNDKSKATGNSCFKTTKFLPWTKKFPVLKSSFT